MNVNQIKKNLRNIIKKKKIKKVTFTEPSEIQNNFKEGSSLEDGTDKIKQLILIEQNLQNNFKKSDLPDSMKKLNKMKKNEDEDEYNVKQFKEKVYSPTELHKINNIQKNLKNNYIKRVINDKYSAEKLVKHYEPLLKELSNVKSSIDDVKEVAIKTDNDIQKMIITTPYKHRQPEVLRILSTEDNDDIKTTKSSPRITTNNSPMPPTIILGENAQKYLSNVDKNNAFGIHYKNNIGHMIGKDPIMFDFDDIILNGKKHILTPGMWRLLTQTDATKPELYTVEDYQNYVKILIETDSIYQNNDKSTGKPKSGPGEKYMKMISPIWKKIKLNKTPTIPTIPTENKNIPIFPTIPIENKGDGLMKYTNNEIEYRYISNMKQLIERLVLITAEEVAGNNGFHNEKHGILKLCKTGMEENIDDPKCVRYLLKFLINLPKETTNGLQFEIKQLREKLYNISQDERASLSSKYCDEKLAILNFCIKKMEKVIDIPEKGAKYLLLYVSSLPKEIIRGEGFFNDFLNCKFLPEIHYPGYNFLGPGTKLEKNREPINKLDEAAREHYYFYKNHKDTKTRHIADKILENSALDRWNDPDSSMNEKIPAILTAYAMKGKRRLGMNLVFE